MVVLLISTSSRQLGYAVTQHKIPAFISTFCYYISNPGLINKIIILLKSALLNNTFATFDSYLNHIAGLNPILRQDTHCPQSLISGQNNTVLEKWEDS